MANSNADAAPRKRTKLSDESHTGRQKVDVGASEEVPHDEGSCSGSLGQKEKLTADVNAVLQSEKKSSGAVSEDNSEQDGAIYDRKVSANEADSNTDDGAGSFSACANVWNTTELLENIIFYLPAKTIIVVSGVNKMSSNCVANSSIAQSKLFLRPSGLEKDIWLYCQFNRMRDSSIREYIIAQDFESSTCMDAYDTNRVAKAFCTLEPVSAVTLCPLLELEDCRKETAMGRIKRNGWHVAERVNLIGMPPESTKYIDMILTDPPTFDVEAHLTFKHTLNPMLMVSATRQVSNPDTALTIGAVSTIARGQLGPVTIHDPPPPGSNQNQSYFIGYGTMDEKMLPKIQQYGGHFELDPKNSSLVFQNKQHVLGSPSSNLDVNRIIVPSDEERLEMEVKRVQNCCSKPLVKPLAVVADDDDDSDAMSDFSG